LLSTTATSCTSTTITTFIVNWSLVSFNVLKQLLKVNFDANGFVKKIQIRIRQKIQEPENVEVSAPVTLTGMVLR